ncbi:MAG: TIGR02391 family protein [Anaerolineae bacterium]|nr:TIGR02391 family protein [Anaerolineae bacterium]
MNLQTRIKPELWHAISSTYQSGNYMHAILDAMHFLSDVIRDKADLEGDGLGLVGTALGGKNPKLKINDFQTESERSEQEGVVQILMGLYRAVRNPRSHEQSMHTKDTQASADAIIYFIDYILGILDKSKAPFTIDDFLIRVFDNDFVESDRYAKLLANEVPAKKRLDVLIEIYRKKSEGDGEKLSYFVRALLNLIQVAEVEDFLSVVSDELKVISDDVELQRVFQILPKEYWFRIDESARLRIENKLLRCFKNATALENRQCNADGALLTWARDFIPFFSLNEQFGDVFLDKLKSHDIHNVRYAIVFFMHKASTILVNPYQVSKFVDALSLKIQANNTLFHRALLNYEQYFPEEWCEKLAEKLENTFNEDGSPVYEFPSDLGDRPF